MPRCSGLDSLGGAVARARGSWTLRRLFPVLVLVLLLLALLLLERRPLGPKLSRALEMA